MSYCKKCFEFVRPDCMLTNGICVFCEYKTNSWDSNGILVKKNNAIYTYDNYFNELRKKFIDYNRDLLSSISGLPKGSIVKKIVRGKTYYYLIKRIGKKIVFKYLGKVVDKKLNEDIKLRQSLMNKHRLIKPLLYCLKISRRPSRKTKRYDILKHDNFTCQYCGRSVADGVKLEVDHIIPVSVGGKNDISNLITSCRECNSQKRAKI